MNKLVIVRGGGDIATGTIHRLHKCGFSVLVLETKAPSSIRRNVSFSEAVYEGEVSIEDVTAKHVTTLEEALHCFENSTIPVMIDEEATIINQLRPSILIDAILAKKNLGTNRSMAEITIALGPGFCAGQDVDAVIETMRGHNLGRIIYTGTAMEDTKTPGNIGGYTTERVMYSPVAGSICNIKNIGDLVAKDEVIATIDETPIKASIPGILRGIIKNGYYVPKGFKIADIDPRYSEQANCFTISDKSRCIAGSVLEAIFVLNNTKLNDPLDITMFTKR